MFSGHLQDRTGHRKAFYQSHRSPKSSRSSRRFTACQTLSFAAFCSCCSVVISNFVKVHEMDPVTSVASSLMTFPTTLHDTNLRRTTSTTDERGSWAARLARLSNNTMIELGDDYLYDKNDNSNGKAAGLWREVNITELDPRLKVIRNGISHPNIAWLMSFPNSGTSYTIHMVREASNCTTGTNYALEGDVRNLPSVQAIEGPQGQNGPFLELIHDRNTNIPNTIMIKTHCTGYCSKCGPNKLRYETPRSFQRGCLTGTRAVRTEKGLEAFDVMYRPSLVKKAIHIFRHPLDNIVARFHLEFNEAKVAGNNEYTRLFPKNAEGFQRWCRKSDEKTVRSRRVASLGDCEWKSHSVFNLLPKYLFETKYIDPDVTSLLNFVPCFNEFFKFVQVSVFSPSPWLLTDARTHTYRLLSGITWHFMLHTT